MVKFLPVLLLVEDPFKRLGVCPGDVRVPSSHSFEVQAPKDCLLSALLFRSSGQVLKVFDEISEVSLLDAGKFFQNVVT